MQANLETNHRMGNHHKMGAVPSNLAEVYKVTRIKENRKIKHKINTIGRTKTTTRHWIRGKTMITVSGDRDKPETPMSTKNHKNH